MFAHVISQHLVCSCTYLHIFFYLKSFIHALDSVQVMWSPNAVICSLFGVRALCALRTLFVFVVAVVVGRFSFIL